MANRDGYALEHRYVLYEAGISVPPGNHVHHVNGDTGDNRLENLVVKTARAHILGHIIERGSTVTNQHGVWCLRPYRPCGVCGQVFKTWNKKSKYCSRACFYEALRGG